MPSRLLSASIFLLLGLAVSPIVAWSQPLSPGDIAVVSLNADNPDEFSFVALTDIAAGTEIKFTDNGWFSSGGFRSGEQTLIYTAPNTLSAGQVVTVTTSGVSAFSVSGDQLLAYQGDDDTPSFIYALNFEGNGTWQTDATSSNTSALPNGLTNGATAVALDEFDNVVYTGPLTGTRASLLAAISDRGNWSGDNDVRQVFTGTFTVAASGGNVFPQFVSSLSDRIIPPGTAFAFSYEATDADGDALTFSLVDAPDGAAIDASTGAFSWTPSASQAEQAFMLTVRVSDGTAITQTTALINVTSSSINQRPLITEFLPDMLIDTGTPISFTYRGSDPDGDVTTFALVNPPPGATMALTTGDFSWTPAEAGVFTIEASISDGTSTTTVRTTVGVRGTLFPGLTGNALRTSLRDRFSPDSTLGYDVARDTMYAIIDATPDGFVRGVYSGFTVELAEGDPSKVVFERGINAEHTWPQSMGAGDEPARSDLHNLFPARANVNSSRSNKPFAMIPDPDTNRWFFMDDSETNIPTTHIDAYSESSSVSFEPREVHQGNTARAALYFYTIYESVAERSFLTTRRQLDYLIAWNTIDDADTAEMIRTVRIAEYQGNINPFVIDPSLALRAFCDLIR